VLLLKRHHPCDPLLLVLSFFPPAALDLAPWGLPRVVQPFPPHVERCLATGSTILPRDRSTQSAFLAAAAAVVLGGTFRPGGYTGRAAESRHHGKREDRQRDGRSAGRFPPPGGVDLVEPGVA
jgi:hypothetical protein